MSQTGQVSEVSEAKRALLQQYLRGVGPSRQTEIIARRDAGRPAPLSFRQEQLWFLAQLAPDTALDNEPITVHLPGPLDVSILERSLSEIVRRHEAWRTTFPTVDGKPVQVVHPPAPLALPVIDLRLLPWPERESEAQRLATEEARRPFDLAQGPLLRLLLVRLNDDEHRLYVTLHHIIMDGVSMYTVFLPELAALYAAFSRGEPSPLPDLPIQYADYAAWQRERLRDRHGLSPVNAELAFWRPRLGGSLPTLWFPAARPRPPLQTFRGAQRPFALPRSLATELKALSLSEGASLFMTLLAAFKALLYRYTGQDDLLVGTATADRKRPETEKLLGFFVNIVPLRTSLSGDLTFRQLLHRVRDVTLDALAHDSVPFEHLVRVLQPHRNGLRNPIIEVICTMEPSLPPLDTGWSLSNTDIDTATAKRDLYLELKDAPHGLIGRFQYNTDIFDATTIDHMCRQYQVLLQSVVADPTQRLADIPLLTSEEREKLLAHWNAPLQ